MPHFTQDQQPVSIGGAVVMTQAQVNEIKQFFTELHETSKKQPSAVLSGDQFSRLEQLLQPGFELSRLMLEGYKRQHEPQPSARMQENESQARQRVHMENLAAARSGDLGAAPAPSNPATASPSDPFAVTTSTDPFTAGALGADSVSLGPSAG